MLSWTDSVTDLFEMYDVGAAKPCPPYMLNDTCIVEYMN